MTNLIIDPTRGLVSLGPDGKEYAISVPAGFSANHCVLMVEPASMGDNGHDVRSAFLLEEGYEGSVEDAENIYDLVSESSNPLWHYAMTLSEVLKHVHVLNSSAVEETGGVFEIKNIENPEFDPHWNGSTNTIMCFYPDVLVTDDHILKLVGEYPGTLRILSSDHGIGTNVVSMNDPRIISSDDVSKIEGIIKNVYHGSMVAINGNGVNSWPRYESGYGSGSVSDVINFNGHAVYVVEVDGRSNGGMFNVFYPGSVDLLEIPHPQNLPFEAEVTGNHSFQFFKSPDNKRLFVLSVVETTLDVSQDENTLIVIHEVDFGFDKWEVDYPPMLREIYCETMGSLIDKLQPYTYTDESPMHQLHYHEFGIVSLGIDHNGEAHHMRVLEIVGDSDEITISNFSAAEHFDDEWIQTNATVVTSDTFENDQ